MKKYENYGRLFIVALCLWQGSAILAANLEGVPQPFNQPPVDQPKGYFDNWVDMGKQGLESTKNWLGSREHFGYYAPALAQGLAGWAEYMANGNRDRISEALVRAGILTAAGHMAPKLVRLGMDYPKLLPSLASIAPLYTWSYLRTIRNETLQELLNNAKFDNLTKTLMEYGLSPLNVVPFAAIGYGAPYVAQGIAASPMPWRAPAAAISGPWMTYMISRYGIHAERLHGFLDRHPAIRDYAQRLMLAGIGPAIIAGIIWAFWGDQIKQAVGIRQENKKENS